MIILNLGAGTKVSTHQDVINVDWSIYFKIKKRPILNIISQIFFKGDRLQRLNSIGDNIIVYDLSKGIPFDSDSIDVVYHSHFLEHLERDAAKLFLKEVRRTLKPNGIQRIVVPDFEQLCKEYLDHICYCEENHDAFKNHDNYIKNIIEQIVRKEGVGTQKQKHIFRYLENFIRGDVKKRGETHQWMYDRFNLKSLLAELKFKNIIVHKYYSSSIPEWNSYGLDLDQNGHEYKDTSLYMEAEK